MTSFREEGSQWGKIAIIDITIMWMKSILIRARDFNQKR
jgi:hypothetical protein